MVTPDKEKYTASGKWDEKQAGIPVKLLKGKLKEIESARSNKASKLETDINWGRMRRKERRPQITRKSSYLCKESKWNNSKLAKKVIVNLCLK